jgi:hypothetical protein
VLPKENPPGGGAGALLVLPPKLNAMLATEGSGKVLLDYQKILSMVHRPPTIDVVVGLLCFAAAGIKTAR